MRTDLYKLLGVAPEADATIIKQRYRILARELHPDRTKGDKQKEHKFKEVAAAYAILSDETRRAAYDRARAQSGSGENRIFDTDFDDLVDRIKDEGIHNENWSSLFEEFVGMAHEFQERAPEKVKRATENPGSLFDLINDLFDINDEGNVYVKPRAKK